MMTYAIPVPELPHGQLYIHCEPHEFQLRCALFAITHPELYRMPRLPIKHTPADMRKPIISKARIPWELQN